MSSKQESVNLLSVPQGWTELHFKCPSVVVRMNNHLLINTLDERTKLGCGGGGQGRGPEVGRFTPAGIQWGWSPWAITLGFLALP